MAKLLIKSSMDFVVTQKMAPIITAYMKLEI